MRKSALETHIIYRRNGKTINQKVIYINKKGTFQWREQCESCKHKGVVGIGFRGFLEEPTCDRDEYTWRRMNGKTEKQCKLWEAAEIEIEVEAEDENLKLISQAEHHYMHRGGV